MINKIENCNDCKYFNCAVDYTLSKYRIFLKKESRLLFFIFKHFLLLLLEGGFYSREASVFLNVFVFKLVFNEHSSSPTISDKKTETQNQLQFYCLFCETLITCYRTVNPTIASAQSTQQNQTEKVLISKSYSHKNSIIYLNDVSIIDIDEKDHR